MSAHERERLAAWIDGELAPGERAAVEAHLGECEECAALLADLEAVDGLARELPLEAPAGYFEAFPARVRSRIEAAGPGRGASRAAWRTPAWTWAAAAALLLGVVTPLTIARLGRDGAPEQAVRVEVDAKDTGPDTGRRRSAAPAVVAPAQRQEPAAAAVAPPSATETGARALEELKKEARRDLDDAEEVSSEARRESLEGFASPPALERPRMSPPSGKGDVPATPMSRDRAYSPPGETHARPEKAVFEADVGVVDEALPEAEAPRPQPALASTTTPGDAQAETRALGRAGAVNTPVAVPSAKSRQGLEAGTGGAPEEARAFQRLNRDDPVGAAAWRERRGAWASFIEEHPESPRLDHARVKVIEAGIAAWRADGDPGDLSRAREDAEAYLARDDARQKDKVRRTLEDIGER